MLLTLIQQGALKAELKQSMSRKVAPIISYLSTEYIYCALMPQQYSPGAVLAVLHCTINHHGTVDSQKPTSTIFLPSMKKNFKNSLM
jgi:hypothetical protein